MHHQCVAPLAANSPHSSLSRAISIASSKVRLCRDRLFFRVAIPAHIFSVQALFDTQTHDRLIVSLDTLPLRQQATYIQTDLLMAVTAACSSPASEPFWSSAGCTDELLHGGQICAMCGSTLLTVTLSTWLAVAGTNVDCADDVTTLPWLRDRSRELVFLLDAGRSFATSLACIPVTLRNSWSSASYWI